MGEVDSGQDLTFYDLVLSIVYCFYSYENRKPRGGMEDGTWNKACCFVYITCTIPIEAMRVYISHEVVLEEVDCTNTGHRGSACRGHERTC
jgi:hypothetical protein